MSRSLALTNGLRLTRLPHSPEFKRVAAIQGDNTFHSGRRAAFSKWATTQNVWSFCSLLLLNFLAEARLPVNFFSNQVWKRRKDLLYIGSVHGGELPEFYGVTGDHLGTDAIGMHLSAVLILVANGDSATS